MSEWKLVPYEPTKEMLDAGREQWHRIGTTADAWQAMFCAAPTPERADGEKDAARWRMHMQLMMEEGCTARRVQDYFTIVDAAILAANKEPQ